MRLSMRFSSKLTKGIALALALTLYILALPPIAVNAQSSVTWTKLGDGCYSLDGSDVVVTISDKTLYVTGTGAIPDYDLRTLYSRPWQDANVTIINIDDTITSIGAYAFADMKLVTHVYLSTSTFIEDSTSFTGLAYHAIFRIADATPQTKLWGSIPYTSLDSLAAFAQTNLDTFYYSYIFDTQYKAESFQAMTNPTIPQVYYAYDSRAPWNDPDEYPSGNKSTTLCSMSTENGNSSYTVTGEMLYKGEQYYEVYSAYLADYQFACSIDMTTTKDERTITKTYPAYQYVVNIPSQYQQLGTTYRLIGIGIGHVYIFDDIDSNPATLTFETDIPTMTFALAYK